MFDVQPSKIPFAASAVSVMLVLSALIFSYQRRASDVLALSSHVPGRCIDVIPQQSKTQEKVIFVSCGGFY